MYVSDLILFRTPPLVIRTSLHLPCLLDSEVGLNGHKVFEEGDTSLYHSAYDQKLVQIDHTEILYHSQMVDLHCLHTGTGCGTDDSV